MNFEKPLLYVTDKRQRAVLRATNHSNIHESLMPAEQHRDDALIDAMIGSFLDDAESHGAVDSNELKLAQERVALLLDYLTKSRSDEEIYADVKGQPDYQKSRTPEDWLLFSISLGARACERLVDVSQCESNLNAETLSELESFLQDERNDVTTIFNNNQIDMIRATVLGNSELQQQLTHQDINRACESLMALMNQTNYAVETTRGLKQDKIKAPERKFLQLTVSKIKQAHGEDRFRAYDELVLLMASHFKSDPAMERKKCDGALNAALRSIKYHLQTSDHAKKAGRLRK